jgi:NAD(P)-dependent dehydrogenase (short-subunit alcohol dehydrogenase family)
LIRREGYIKDAAKKQKRLGEVPLGRLATEADVADEAAFLTGVALPVDGGTTAD